MGTRSSTAQKFFSDEISRALSRAGLDYNHPIREVLDRKAEIVGVRDGTKRHFSYRARCFRAGRRAAPSAKMRDCGRIE
jgi:hypothetical protein